MPKMRVHLNERSNETKKIYALYPTMAARLSCLVPGINISFLFFRRFCFSFLYFQRRPRAFVHSKHRLYIIFDRYLQLSLLAAPLHVHTPPSPRYAGKVYKEAFLVFVRGIHVRQANKQAGAWMCACICESVCMVLRRLNEPRSSYHSFRLFFPFGFCHILHTAISCSTHAQTHMHTSIFYTFAIYVHRFERQAYICMRPILVFLALCAISYVCFVCDCLSLSIQRCRECATKLKSVFFPSCELSEQHIQRARRRPTNV